MTYTPRPGSYSARALAALASGPLPSRALSSSLGLRHCKLLCRIRTALEHGAIVRSRVGGRVVFAAAEGAQ